ncbi:unnamed protein product [Brachionus calyciflorus]|uniref:Uncharacterized protein n=1 Tax=Brachionus calyciflorus TaxID=104777 RepID=A0A814DVH4_9BILA|nr:unnamed protein product [Brachionus calyciflorus]
MDEQWKICERTGNKTTPKCYGRAQTQLSDRKPVDHNHEPDPIKEDDYTTKILALSCFGSILNEQVLK